jgi:hypothetical protein
MKTVVAFSVLAMATFSIGSAAIGQSCTSQQIGNFTYHNCSNGLNGSSQQLGDFTYHNFNNGSERLACA